MVAMDEPHIGCTPNVIPGSKLPATPTLHACTRDCPTEDSSSWAQINVCARLRKPYNEETAGSGTEQSRYQNAGYRQSCRDFPYDRLADPTYQRCTTL
ncbi:hypothetical protein TNCV_911451 [Trichonephila clavipes]|nr:hypothetical protein TNCV_911451 [Trichonephila clavipes]